MSPGAPHFGLRELALYATSVVVWGFSWYALKAQLGVVSAEVSGFYRFLIAAAILWAWVAIARERVRFGWREHRRLAALGVTILSCNFLSFYYAAYALPSGLLAVIFSLAPVVNVALAAILLRAPVEPRVLVGALIGVAGVAALFLPQVAAINFDAAAFGALALGLFGTLLFCLGNILLAGVRRDGFPIISVNAWGMTYGAATLLAISLARGQPFIVEWTWTYGLSMLWLSVFASVIAFWAYQDLVGRIGAPRASYTTVLYPLIALAVSTFLEGFVWTPLAMFGVALALLGNVIVLNPGAGAAK